MRQCELSTRLPHYHRSVPGKPIRYWGSPMRRLNIAGAATPEMSIGLLSLDQIRALQEMGHEVIAGCAPGRWVEQVRHQGVVIETVEMTRELSPVSDLRITGRALIPVSESMNSMWYTLTRHKLNCWVHRRRSSLEYWWLSTRSMAFCFTTLCRHDARPGRFARSRYA